MKITFSTFEQASVKFNSKSDWKKWFHNVKSIIIINRVNVWPYIDLIIKQTTPISTEPTRLNPVVIINNTIKVERTIITAKIDIYR